MKILLFANTDWYLYNFRRSLAENLKKSGYDVVLLSPPGKYGENLREMGYRWFPAPMERRSLNIYRELMFLMWLVNFIKVQKIDAVHCFTIKCVIYGSVASIISGVGRRINAVAGMGYIFSSGDARAIILRPFVKVLLRFALNGKFSKLILQNPDDVELFVKNNIIGSSKIHLIPGSGVDCVKFSPRPVVGGCGLGCGDDIKVLLPARILWDKGVAEYVEASEILKREGRKICFFIAGDPDFGNPAAVPESSLIDFESAGLIVRLGHVNDMPKLFNCVDIVVLPSYREGLPKGLIEAAACGVALVTTDVPGCREVVDNEVNGLLVPVKNSESLARAIARLQDDSDLRLRLGRAAREKALAEFDERIVIDKTVNVYHELGVVP